MTIHASVTTDSNSSEAQRVVLAIDYGRRRLGLALSDGLGITARPLAVWERTNRRKDITRLREICRKHEVGRIVVGWPIRLDGTPGEMAQEASSFAERLRKHLGRPVELCDERLTSWAAGQQLVELDSRRAGTYVDDIAATIILRDYLARVQQPGAQDANQSRRIGGEKAG